MEQIAFINPQEVTEEEVRTYRVREAARAIVQDSDGKVAMLHVSNKNYYKLPGGGIDEGEEKIAALHRECMEEIGCTVEVVGEVGMVVEYRRNFQVKQVSYCYFANVVGEKGTPSFTEHEKSGGFGEVWVTYDEALDLLAKSKGTDIEGEKYIVPRDTALLLAAKKYL